ncbi:PREDICTED: protein furry isoform X4 [Polistes canadensis]|uniref:protein furry isoform X4 n=1 Tax=Polistes canadensis TaxID=91411 RepID=UPI000718D7BC|nr:PREDICTED: protein furry isoform X4 [Polistes canadensis]
MLPESEKNIDNMIEGGDTQSSATNEPHTESSESRIVHSEGLHEGTSISISQTNPETGQELLTVHGATQGESSDAVSIHTASTSASGNESSSSRVSAITVILPWGAQKETVRPQQIGDMDLSPGEFVMRTSFAKFTAQAEKKMEAVMTEHEKALSKILQRGEDPQFDQLLSAFGSVAEHCLPSILRALFNWYERQLGDKGSDQKKPAAGKEDQKGKSIMYTIVSGSVETVERSEADLLQERRDLAVEFIFCLMLIEVLRQLPFHPGHEDLVTYIENIAFKHFKYREGIQNEPNAANIHIIADLYAEVIGVLAQSRFMSVRKRFMVELKELRAKEPGPHTTQSIISLLMGMKFFRVKMVPIEEFEASFQFMQECAQYFLEVKDKDVKHALAGLFVEILVPVAAAVKNEVNVPCLKNFVEMLYSTTLDMCTKSKHRLALFPLVTCLLCVSQKTFFLQNWHYFLAMCLSQLKNRDPKMCRVALEALYRLLWVYMIRVKCESNSATQSRLQSIVNSLFPKGSKAVVPRDTPLNIFVKIIQFIAQERLDFAMREIVFDLLSVGRPVKIILTPERMSIGLRAFLVVADSLQQKEGEPPMPRTMGVLPSGNTVRVKKTFLNKMLTEDTARSIGMSSYFPHVRRVFVDILRALDVHYGRPLMMTSTQNMNKEPDEMITGERKPRIDLFRTCVAAVPRLIPDGMTGAELVDLLSRLTVHMDEELRGLAYQSLQTLALDFPDWRQDVVLGFTQFLARDVQDTFPQLVDNGLRMLLQLLTSWKNALISPNIRLKEQTVDNTRSNIRPNVDTTIKRSESGQKVEPVSCVFHLVEGFALVMLCNCRLYPRRLAVHILRELKFLLKILGTSDDDQPVIDVIDACCPTVLEKCYHMLPPAEKAAAASTFNIDLQWIADRSSCVWTAGFHDENSTKSSSSLNLNGADPWGTCLFAFLEKDRVLTQCSNAVAHSWPIVFTRINSLFSVVDPTPVNDNRASLLRSSTAVRKPVNERDVYMHVWKNYLTFGYRVVPPVPSPVVRCASPDLSLSGQHTVEFGVLCMSKELSQSLENLGGVQTLPGRFSVPSISGIYIRHKRTSSSPDSLSAERGDNKSPGTNASPAALYKLTVPLLRCEAIDVRDAAVQAIGKVNADALKDLMEELVPYIREAVDRKQENMRRRRRRDALRLQLVRVLELIAEYGTFGICPAVLDRETQSLHPTFVEYIDGARIYLENETDKEAPAVRDIKLHFCNFIRKMIESFSLETCHSLLKRDLRRNLFMLFASWAGPYGRPLTSVSSLHEEEKTCTELQFSALQAMSGLLCCGPCFNPQSLSEEGAILYQWLDLLLASKDEKIYALARETVVLLLEGNPDIGALLDWVVDRCYTGAPHVADGCFLALATIFSAREYPCDHYTSIINVTLMNTGCPRAPVHDEALQLLQLLDQRFFGNVGPLPATEPETGQEDLAGSSTATASGAIQQSNPTAGVSSSGTIRGGTLDVLLSTTYCRSQMYLSRQLAQLHPELTMPMFSEITHRFQTARREVRQLLLQYLLPWLHNMELVDPNVPPPSNPLSYYQYYASEITRGGARREGWGSAEATEMVLNNLFYITAKFSDEHPKDIEELWATLCGCWPNNLKVILRYLIIVSGMAPQELLSYAKRVVLYLARARPDRLVDEMMTELQTVETLNCLIERTETPPFYRLTSMRKASSHSDAPTADPANPPRDLGVEKDSTVCNSWPATTGTGTTIPPVIVTPEDSNNWVGPQPGPNMPIQDVIKSLINFLASRINQPLWNYEDMTAKVWWVRSAEQLTILLRHVLRVFRDSLPHALVSQRWAQIALQLGLSCSSRHYAGRSLQVFRALRVPITSRMLSDILSRLVETVAEQGEDMQGYVTELLLTLEAAVDSLESDFRPLDFMKEIFKSTPNLNNKDPVSGIVIGGKRSPGINGCGPTGPQILSHLNQVGHTRSTSYSVSYCMKKSSGGNTAVSELKELDNRGGCNKYPNSNLSRSRSAQSLKLLGDSATQDDKMTILAQLFWLSVSLLESDYEHEFLLALRLLSRVLHRLPLDRPDARDKVEKLQQQLRWNSFPGVHALLLKGCTSPNTYEPVVTLLSQFTPLLDLPVVDPTQSLAFPMNVVSLLPYMLLHYEDANELCIRSAENIAQVSAEKGKKLENLGTVMTLYSRRTFSKESFQWTKCVVKYLYDTYAHLSFDMLAFLVEVLEKGPGSVALPVLSIIHCILHYVDLASQAAQPINTELLQVISKYVEGPHWKEALKILKLVVTRSSTLVAPPTSMHVPSWESSLASPHPSFTDTEIFTKKELPGRTMDFTFDLSQTPVIGRRWLIRQGNEEKSSSSPQCSMSLSPAESTAVSGWKRPWMSQGRVRECLVNLLTTCGQRVGLPKSPSVIFSQSSDLMERQSSMASSTEEVSGANNDLSGGSRRDDEQFGVFKDFDFLEYESESVEGESTDNFNWGVRRRPLSEGEEREPSLRQFEESLSEKTQTSSKHTTRRGVTEESSDDEAGSESPLDEVPSGSGAGQEANSIPGMFPPSSLSIPSRTRHDSSTRSDTSGSSAGDLGDVTPCNASPNLSALMPFRQVVRDDAEEIWRQQIQALVTQAPYTTLDFFQLLSRIIRDVSSKSVGLTREACALLSNGSPASKQLGYHLSSHAELLSAKAEPPLVWFSVSIFSHQRLHESLRFEMLEIQQHLETFPDRKYHATECLETVKATTKLQALGGTTTMELGFEEMFLDLGRSFYKLHLQLLLLIKASNKMLGILISAARNVQIPLQDISTEISNMKTALSRALEESTESERGTPTPTPSPSPLPAVGAVEDIARVAELLRNARWCPALEAVRLHRAQWPGDPFHDDDDVTTAVNMYCKHLGQDRSDIFVVTRTDDEMVEIFNKLMSSLFQVLTSVTGLEGSAKSARAQQDHSNHSKNDC